MLGAGNFIPRPGKSKTTQARQQVISIMQAFKEYQVEYDTIPLLSEQDEDLVSSGQTTITSMQLIKILLNYSTDPSNNPRGIKFLSWLDNYATADANGGKGDWDGIHPDNWIDPWGNPYVVAIDYDQSGKLTMSNMNDPDNYSELHGDVFIFSRGPDGLDSSLKTIKTKAFIDAEYDLDDDEEISVLEARQANTDNICSWQ